MKNVLIAVLLAIGVALGGLGIHRGNQAARLQKQLADTLMQLQAAQDQLAQRTEADEKIALTETKAKVLQETLTETSAASAKQLQQVSQLEQSLAAAKTNSGGFASLFKDPDMR